MIEVRRLTPDDAPALFELRLKALRTDPDAFLATEAEDRARGVQWFAERLADHDRDRGCAVLGGFADGELSGMVGFFRPERGRARHRAVLWGMWVAPAARRRGLARALIDEALAHLRTVDGVEGVTLSVTTGQTGARALYERMGFEVWGLEPRAIKTDSGYLDEQHMWRLL